jgi:uncharacterized protein
MSGGHLGPAGEVADAAGGKGREMTGRSTGAASAGGRPWRIPFGALRRSPGTRQLVEVAAPIPEMAVSDSWVPEEADVSFSGTVESVIGGAAVRGRIRAPWEGICRRCLEAARGELDIEVREICTDEPDADLSYPIGSDWLDLEPIVHDACILELPLAPLCRDDCQGLCPVCGVNRNFETCSCEAPVDPRWSALAVLRPENGESETNALHRSGPDRTG